MIVLKRWGNHHRLDIDLALDAPSFFQHPKTGINIASYIKTATNKITKKGIKKSASDA